MFIEAGSDYLGEGTLVQVEEIIDHEKYNTKYQIPDYDFSLLKLKEPLKFSDKINSIELPKQDEEVEPGTFCMISGWGQQRFAGVSSRQLRAATMVTVELAECARSWIENDFTEGYILLSRQMICVGEETTKISACKGKKLCIA